MELITRSPDLKQLYDDGYEIQIAHNHIVLHSVPYLNAKKELAYAVLVSNIDLAGDVAQYGPSSNHQVYFAGDRPCGVDGTELQAFGCTPGRQEILPGLWIDHAFSAKPEGNYRDYHHKMTAYIKKLRAPLIELGIEADARTYRTVDSQNDSPFHFPDTNSGRGGMTVINNRVTSQKVAILGLGGTGSYVLDFLAKMPIAEIHMFDGDVLLSHNTFRAPGSPSIEQLREMINKAVYHAETYSRMHKGIQPHDYHMTEARLSELDPFNFVFICMDSSPEQQKITEYLLTRSIPFVNSGLNMRVHDSTLRGQVRTTLITPQHAEKLKEYIPPPPADPDKEVYESNAQIAEMNALNAVMAVIAWKRLYGIYDDLGHPDHSVFKIRNGDIFRYED